MKKTIYILSFVVCIMLVTIAVGRPTIYENEELIMKPSGFVNPVDVIEQAYYYYNDEETQTKIEIAKETIQEKINELPEEQQNIFMELINFNETFDRDLMLERIDELTVLNLYQDVQSLLNSPSDKNHFNDTYTQETIKKILTFLSYDNFEIKDEKYKMVCEICYAISDITLIYAIPLGFIFGYIGLIIASILTTVFFSPILFPMILYVGICECMEDDIDFTEELRAIFPIAGMVGVILYGLFLLIDNSYDKDYFSYSWNFVMKKLLINKICFGLENDYLLATWSYKPEALDYNINNNILKVQVYDNDYCYWLFGSGFRDLIQVGIDENNDKQIDEWTDLYKPNEIAKVTIDVNTNHVNFKLRDQWGETSTWYSLKTKSDLHILPHPLEMCKSVIDEEVIGKFSFIITPVIN